MQRHSVDEFQPKATLDIIREQRDQPIEAPLKLTDDQQKKLIEQYLDVSLTPLSREHGCK